MNQRLVILSVIVLWSVANIGCGSGSTNPIEEGDLVLEIAPGVKMAFVRIEPGTFMMGAPNNDIYAQPTEPPQHQVTLTKGFYLGKFEVTQQQWEALMGTRPWEEDGLPNADSLPATNIYLTWNGVYDFVNKLNELFPDRHFRLPTEAEWEYACRAGTTTPWPFGTLPFQEKGVKEHAWYSGNSEGTIHKVGLKLPNPWGIYDMHGNAGEWVSDWFAVYPNTPQVDPTGPATTLDLRRYGGRVFRGGTWRDDFGSTRSTSRSYYSEGGRNPYIGFRVICESP